MTPEEEAMAILREVIGREIVVVREGDDLIPVDVPEGPRDDPGIFYAADRRLVATIACGYVSDRLHCAPLPPRLRSPIDAHGWDGLINLAVLYGDVSTLRFDTKLATLRIKGMPDELALAFEIVSGAVCERCGAPGRTRTDRPWWRTLCDEHAS